MLSFYEHDAKSIREYLKFAWKEIIRTNVRLPVPRITIYNENGEFSHRKSFHWWPQESAPREDPIIIPPTSEEEDESEQVSSLMSLEALGGPCDLPSEEYQLMEVSGCEPLEYLGKFQNQMFKIECATNIFSNVHLTR